MNFFSLFKRNLLFKLKKKSFIDSENIESKSLDELFYYYGSDKAEVFKKTGAVGHGYTNFYLKHLKDIKDKKINILELGSFAGASAAAFVKYFPNAKVFCFDINISNFKYKSRNIEVYGLDINNKITVEKTLKKIFKKNRISNFDIIIDDGSHYLSDILFSINYFFKYLKTKGFFIIEDYKHPNYYKYNKNINHILVDEVLNNLKNKVFFNSSIISNENQKYLMNSINQIDTYEGNLKDSNICFIYKK